MTTRLQRIPFQPRAHGHMLGGGGRCSWPWCWCLAVRNTSTRRVLRLTRTGRRAMTPMTVMWPMSTRPKLRKPARTGWALAVHAVSAWMPARPASHGAPRGSGSTSSPRSLDPSQARFAAGPRPLPLDHPLGCLTTLDVMRSSQGRRMNRTRCHRGGLSSLGSRSRLGERP